MFRQYIRRLSRSRFWISKWTVAAAIFGAMGLFGLAMVIRQDVDFYTFLNYFALGLLIFVLVTLVAYARWKLAPIAPRTYA